jgi:hypothetical protein
MFPVFSVLFPVCSQLKRGKQSMFPVFYDLRRSQEMKMQKHPGMFGLTRNTKNGENQPNYQDLTAFPVGTSYWERGNNRTVMDERFRNARRRFG